LEVAVDQLVVLGRVPGLTSATPQGKLLHMRILLALLLLAIGAQAAADTQDPDFNKVFDRHKGGIYALYARALKDNPHLQGKAVLHVEVASSGEVADCRVQSSTLGAPDLEQKICARIRQMKFSPRAAPLKATKTVEFFPAARRP
jgi:TonB family protein